MRLKPRVQLINDLDEIPAFATEKEEAEYWDTHGLSEELWDSLPEADLSWIQGRRHAGSLRIDLDEEELRRIEEFAHAQGCSPAALARALILEGLERLDAGEHRRRYQK